MKYKKNKSDKYHQKEEKRRKFGMFRGRRCKYCGKETKHHINVCDKCHDKHILKNDGTGRFKK